MQWGVVQLRLPEMLCELQREQGDMCEMLVQHGQYMSLCMYVHSAVKYIHNTKIL